MPEAAQPEKSGGLKIVRNTLLVVAVVLAIPILAGIWFLSDTERVKHTLEDLVGNFTGRPLNINGDFDFSIGKELTLKGKDVVWVNPAWSSTPNMLEVSEIEVSFSIWSFIDTPVIITNGVASDAKLEFEWTEDDKFNWWFGDESDDTENEQDDGPRRIPLLLDKTKLTNIDIRFQHPNLTEPLLVEVGNAEQQQDAENHLQINIEADVDKMPSSVQGRLGPFPSLIAGGAIDFELRGKSEESDIRLLGKIGELAELSDVNLEFLLDAGKVENVLDNLNLPVVTSGSMNVKGVIMSDDERFKAKINGPVGEFQIDADVEISDVSTLQGLKLAVKSKGPSARAAGAVVGLDGLPQTAYTLSASAADTGNGIEVKEFLFKTQTGRLESSGTIRNYPDFNESDLEIKVDLASAVRFDDAVPALLLPDLPLSLDAKIVSNGIGKEDDFTSQVSLGTLQADLKGKLTDNSGFAGSTLNFNGNAPDGRILANLLGMELTAALPVDAKGELGIAKDSVSFTKTELKFGKNQATFDATIPTSDDTPIKIVGKVAGPDFDSVSRLLNASDLAPPIDYEFRGNIELNQGSFVVNSVKGNLGRTKLDVKGTLDAREVILTGDFAINAEGQSLSGALLQLGIEQIPDEAFTFKTDLSFDANGFDFQKTELSYKNNSISGRIQAPLSSEKGITKFNLKGTGNDLGLMLSEVEGYEPAKVNFSSELIGEYDEDHIQFDKAILTAGSSKLELSGKLTLAPKLQANDIKLAGSGEKISDLGAFEGFRFAELPFKISATLKGSENVLATNDLEFTVGKSNVSGRFAVNAEGKPAFRLKLASNLLNLERIVADDGTADNTESNDQTTDDEKLIPDIAIPAELLNAYNARVDLDIEKLITQTITLDEFRVDGTLQENKLDIYHIEGKADRGNVDAKISLTPDKDDYLLEMKLNSTGTIFDIPGVVVKNPLGHPGHRVDVDVTARGKGLRELAASLDGSIWVQGGGREIENLGATKYLGDFLSTLVTTINPFSKEDPYTEIVCDLYYFEADQGVLKTAPTIFWRTDKLNIAAEGKINLATEGIDFKFGVSPRRGIGISASDIVNPFTRVDGTLAKPTLALNKTGALVEGGAAVVTVGLSIVAKGLWKRWLGPRKPCEKMLAEATKIRDKREAAATSGN